MFDQRQHPITPPEELVQEWCDDWYRLKVRVNVGFTEYVAIQVARWGADQQLNADCEWLHRRCLISGTEELRAAMRPKPPSLKEQALTQLDSLHADLKAHGLGTNTDIIRRALERLQELENND
jgi:hypothetical protein